MLTKRFKERLLREGYSVLRELGVEIDERELTPGEEEEKEELVKGMKKNKSDFKKRYGDDAESVMYATATKMAKESAITPDQIKKNPWIRAGVKDPQDDDWDTHWDDDLESYDDLRARRIDDPDLDQDWYSDVSDSSWEQDKLDTRSGKRDLTRTMDKWGERGNALRGPNKITQYHNTKTEEIDEDIVGVQDVEAILDMISSLQYGERIPEWIQDKIIHITDEVIRNRNKVTEDLRSAWDEFWNGTQGERQQDARKISDKLINGGMDRTEAIRAANVLAGVDSVTESNYPDDFSSSKFDAHHGTASSDANYDEAMDEVEYVVSRAARKFIKSQAWKDWDADPSDPDFLEGANDWLSDEVYGSLSNYLNDSVIDWEDDVIRLWRGELNTAFGTNESVELARLCNLSGIKTK